MHNFNRELYQRYSENIFKLLSHFTDSDERTEKVMKNLNEYIDNGTALVGGHIIDNQLASFIWCFERCFGGSRRLHISYFIVHDNFRGHGLSKDLLEFAKQKAKKLDIELIDLNVEPDNLTAIKVYESSGFHTEKLQLVMEVDKGEENV